MKELINTKVNEIGIKHLLDRIKKYIIWFFENTNKIGKLYGFGMDLEVHSRLNKERSIEIEKKYRQTINNYKVHISMDK